MSRGPTSDNGERDERHLLPVGSEQRRASTDGTSTDSNGRGENGSDRGGAMVPSGSSVPTLANERFDQAVVLRQSAVWPRALTWTVLAVVAFALGWAYFARIEEVVQATGQLKPTGKVKEVQAPVEGVVAEIPDEIEDGADVQAGETLLVFDRQTARAQQESFEAVKDSLEKENRFYRQLMASATASPNAVEAAIANLELPPEVAALARNRLTLMAENQLYRAQLGGSAANISSEERARLLASQAEAQSRAEAARLEVEELQKQLSQIGERLRNARTQFETEREILNELEPLLEDGAVARLQVMRQEQQMQERESEVQQLVEEQLRIQSAILQARQEYQNALATSQKDIYDRIGENTKQIAQIDSQLNKSIVENEKRIAELQSQIEQANQRLRYQEVTAPISGKIFDLQAYEGFVANPSETLLKIVPGGPENPLIAEIFITNKDIGFVEPGQSVDVRIDTFPFSEFGDIKGTVEWIGDDALPPDEVYDFYRFPARIKLDAQQLRLDAGDNAGKVIQLGSGMSITANVKIREDRRVIDLVLDRFNSTVIDPVRTTR